LQGCQAATGNLVLILPIDATLDTDSLRELASAALSGAFWGGFQKAYQPQTGLLRLYAWLQNAVRLSRGHLVWTNGIFFIYSKTDLDKIPICGFLEDVMFSDEMRKKAAPKILKGPILVSSRRYYPDRIFARICVNLLIIFLHRSRLVGIARLQRLYKSLK
jgi:hypothetical protein